MCVAWAPVRLSPGFLQLLFDTSAGYVHKLFVKECNELSGFQLGAKILQSPVNFQILYKQSATSLRIFGMAWYTSFPGVKPHQGSYKAGNYIA